MYRRPRFLAILIAIREEMAREADFDVDLFVENLRTGHRPPRTRTHSMGNVSVPRDTEETERARKVSG